MNYLVRSESGQYHECGYSCDNGLLLSLAGETFFLTDARYTVEAGESARATVIETRDLEKTARELIRKSGEKGLVYDPMEWTQAAFDALSKKLPGFRFSPKPDFSPKRRMVKTDEEIQLLREAVRLGAQAFDDLAAYLREHGEGKSEKTLTWEAKAFLSARGERELSFDPILALNANAAKPHALPTDVKLAAGDLLLFDAGTKYKRYCSDRTRTFQFGPDAGFGTTQTYSDKTRQKVYDLVLKAHDAAIEAARTGMTAMELDGVARKVIEEGGYGKEFVHSLGHGVGLDIHEHPYINKRNDTVLEENMVFTIEPGIYLPGEFGVRIEDMVVMKNGKAQVL